MSVLWEDYRRLEKELENLSAFNGSVKVLEYCVANFGKVDMFSNVAFVRK